MVSRKTDNINVSIARELFLLRKEAGYTSYEKFAIEFGFARKHYWMVEKGKIRITIEYLERVLLCHNITLCTFFDKLSR
jgi:transcriptional regulator with XRE-family HTH domain